MYLIFVVCGACQFMLGHLLGVVFCHPLLDSVEFSAFWFLYQMHIFMYKIDCVGFFEVCF